jgi:hypothetical protein
MSIYYIFHITFLELAATDLLPSQQIIPTPQVELDGGQVWEVSQVLEAQMFRKSLQYLI